MAGPQYGNYATDPMKGCAVVATALCSLLIEVPAQAQLDFWNKPKIEAPSRQVSLNRCLRELENEVARMLRDSDSILRSSEFTKIEYRRSYCIPKQTRFRDVGWTLGKVVYLQEYRDAPDSLEIMHVTVVYGDFFPWGS